MEKKYINESRYKKNSSRKRRSVSTVKTNLSKTSVNRPETSIKTQKENLASKKKVVKKTVKKKSKIHNIMVCVILLILIALLSRAILKDENEPFIPVIFGENENEETVTIGIITNENLQDINTSNVILSEINSYSKDMLLKINEDYSITYKCLSKVEKVSNKEYILTKDTNSNVTVNEIKNALENYMKDDSSKYYSKLNNVDKITILDENKINILLKKDNPYFIYNLDINLTTVNDDTTYLRDNQSSENMLVLNRHKKADKSLPKKIVVKKYEDMYDAVEAYKKEEINMFVTNADNVENILGRYEYNIKTYRNGETLFLLGNTKSELWSKLEVRQAIAYSINRDYIIDEVLKSKGDKIDLPYIFDEVKYRYDVYAAENILLSNGYSKKNKVYQKTENGKTTTLKLNLLVNKDDEEKLQVANIIKNNLSAIGISINVEKLTQSKLEKRVKEKNYDLVLATVNLNSNPDISFIQDSLYITEDIQNIQKQITEGDTENLQVNISALRNSMSENISVIGIYSKVSNLIYSKSIVGIDKINYMNILNLN